MKFVCSLTFIASLLAASPAICQEATGSPNGAPFQRYLAGFGGAAAIGSDTTATFAVEFGENVTRHAAAYASLSYFDNVMTEQMRDNLVAAANNIRAITGVTRSFSGRDRGIAFTGGGKLTGGTRIRPYIGAGAGLLNIQRAINESTLGDVSLAFAEQTGFGDGIVSTGETEANKPLGEVVAGVGFVTSKAYFDIGYRYRHAFHTATTLDFSEITVGIGAKW